MAQLNLTITQEEMQTLLQQDPGQQHLKLGEKDIKKTLRIQGGSRALFPDADPAAKVSIFAECQSSFTQNIQVERGHIFTGPGGILVKDDIQTPV